MKSGVLNLVLKRLAVAVVTLLIVLFAVFFATSMLPGDTASILLGQAATPEAVAGLREAMHLNDPAILRFLRWLSERGRLEHTPVGPSGGAYVRLADSSPPGGLPLVA